MSSTKRGAVRNDADFYVTPEGAFKPLIPWLPRQTYFWEPCCGDGRLIRWLRESGREAGGADLNPRPEWPCDPVDFLEDESPRNFIITNPPFSRAQECVDRALSNSTEVMMLLRLNFLGAQKRREWWRMNEPSALFVLSARPDFTGGGGDSCEYAWFYWGHRFQGIRHL